MNKLILLALAPMALWGCANPDGTYGEVGSLAWFNSAAPAAKKAYYEKQCASYGFKPGTDGMAQCKQREVMAVNDAFDRQHAADAAAIPRQTNCTKIGNSMHCTSF